MMDGFINKEYIASKIRSHNGINSEFHAKMVEEAPEADVVEVVRCRDCVDAREPTSSESYSLVSGCLICTNCDASLGGFNPVLPNHFCSYGDRRESDG